MLIYENKATKLENCLSQLEKKPLALHRTFCKNIEKLNIYLTIKNKKQLIKIFCSEETKLFNYCRKYKENEFQRFKKVIIVV